MSKRFILGAALVAALAIPAYARAHEGHAHKVMGTVSGRHANQLEITTTDGKTITIALNEKTSVLRGKEKVDLTGVKEGDRVVINVGNGKEPLTAREIKVGAPLKK